MNKQNLLARVSRNKGKIYSVLTAIISTFALYNPAHAATFGQNLIVNGGAEEGEADAVGNAVGADIPTIPGWNPTANFSVLKYGASGFQFLNPSGQTVQVSGLPDVNSPGPADRGLNFFYGGGARSSSTASQSIDVADLSSVIDAGKGAYDFSGWLGGYRNDDDNVLLEATFSGQNNQSLGKISLASPTAAQRNSTTGLFFQSTNGILPVGTRNIDIVLNMNYTRGRVNDAYADNLSLVVTAVPEHNTSPLLIGATSIVLWGMVKKRRLFM